MFHLVTTRHDIPEAEFPDYVNQMHQDGDQKFEQEYRVRITVMAGGKAHYVIAWAVCCVQSLDKLPQPASEVACLSCNMPHNRFKNIYPCEYVVSNPSH